MPDLIMFESETGKPVVASASNPLPFTGTIFGPNGRQADQRLTVDATAGGVQFSAFHAATTNVFWSCEDQQCRVTFDSSAPTTTNGHVINAGDSGIWPKALATAAKFIRTTGASATIHASQLK